MVPFVPEAPPALARTSVLLAAGAHDPLVPQEGTRNLAEILTAAGADVELVWSEAGHGLVRADVDATGRFLSRFGEAGAR